MAIRKQYDTIRQVAWALENNKFEYGTFKLDTSEVSWKTVRQYKSNSVASDSEDETKIHKAESWAMWKRKEKKKPTEAKSASHSINSGTFRNMPMFHWVESRMPSLVYLDLGRLCHSNNRTCFFLDNPILTIPFQEVKPILRAENSRTSGETILISAREQIWVRSSRVEKVMKNTEMRILTL